MPGLEDPPVEDGKPKTISHILVYVNLRTTALEPGGRVQPHL